ncbi:MAG: choice-of-anchor D domain-containing protein [Deltaproteobacteria bacterium]|nr:choice-of-anchor D domain-containing protein [Deltaproteobacteria bacterium]
MYVYRNPTSVSRGHKSGRVSSRLTHSCAALVFALLLFSQVAIASPPRLFPWSGDTQPLGVRTPLVLIHGLSYVGAQAYERVWDDFVTYLHNDTRLLDDYKVYFFAYDTVDPLFPGFPGGALLPSDPQHIGELGASLLRQIVAFDQPAVPYGFKERPMVIVAHSMGGLVARSFMQEQHFTETDPGGVRTLRLITLGTPHHGTPLANFGYAAGPAQNRLFGAGQGFLADMRWDEYDLVQVLGTNDWLRCLNNHSSIHRFDDTSAACNGDDGFYSKIVAYGAESTNFSGDLQQGSLWLGWGFPPGLGYLYFDTDGAVPIESATFRTWPIMQSREFQDCDHNELPSKRCPGVFSWLEEDLRNARPVLWQNRPPFRSMVAGHHYDVGWRVNWGRWVTHADVHWSTAASGADPADPNAPCSDSVTPGCHTTSQATEQNPQSPGLFLSTITAPGVTQPTRFLYRVHVVVDGVDLWSETTWGWSYPSPPPSPGVPVVQLDRSSIIFDAQVVNTASALKIVQVTNVGTADLQIDGVSLTNTGDFLMAADACSGRTISLQDTCRIALQFLPKTATYRTGTLTISSNAATSPDHVSLGGSGVAPAGPQVSLSSSQLTFGNQQIGTPSAAQTVVVRNVGTLPLAVTEATIVGTHVSDFQKTFDTCTGSTINVGAACSVAAIFVPTVIGNRTAALQFSDNAPGGLRSVALTGTGTSPTGAAVTLFPTSLGFGDQEVGTTSPTQTVTVRNVTASTMTIVNIFRGAGDPDFDVTNGPTLPLSLPSGGAATFGVVFTAQAMGVRSGYITVAYNPGGGPQTVSLPVRGTGIAGPSAPAPAITFSVSGLAFASQLVGTTSGTQNITVRNTGTAELRITNIYPAGLNPTDFDRDPNCMGNWAPNATCTMGVRFRPQAGGTRSANLIFESNASGSPHSIRLSGTGTLPGNPAATLSPPSLDFNGQPVGSMSRIQRFDLTNNGLSPLHITSMVLTGANTSDFSVSFYTYNCGWVTPPTTFGVGVTCSLDVRFTPTGSGPRTAFLTMTDDAPDSPQDLQLTGMGTSPVTTGPVVEFPVPTSSAKPFGITSGPDGNLWFTEADANKIGRITPSGSVVEFATLADCPGRASTGFPCSITTGPDGNLWFTDDNCAQIGRVTPFGAVTKLDLPTAGSGARFIVTGADGNLWFSEGFGNRVGRITTSGVITEFSIPTGGANPAGIALGSDGDIWFGEQGAKKIGRIKTGGTIDEFPLPGAQGGPHALTLGPDANVWFVEQGQSPGNVGRITPDGSFAEFPVSLVSPYLSSPLGIASGRDGAVWFTEQEANLIGRLTPDGQLAEFQIPTTNSNPLGITSGPDGNIWFTEGVGKIGRITLPLTPATTLNASALQFGTQLVGTASAPQSLIVTNTGNGTLNIGTVALGGSNPGDFSIVTNGCSAANLAPGGSCALSVRFLPGTVGSRSASVTINHNAPGSPQIALLNGTGVAASPTPTLTPSPTSPPTATRTPSNSPTAVFTRTPTTTPTATSTRTPTKSPTSTRTRTNTPTQTGTRTPTPTPSSTLTRTITATRIPSPSRTPTFTLRPTRTHTPTFTSKPSATPTRTATKRPTSTPTRTPTATHTRAPSMTPTLTPSRRPSRTPTATRTPFGFCGQARGTCTPGPTNTRRPSPTPTPSWTRRPTFTQTATWTRRPSATPTRTFVGYCGTAHGTCTPTRTPTATPSPQA